MSKCCSKCHTVQPETDFIKKHNICKGCNRIKMRDYKTTQLTREEPVEIPESKECRTCKETKAITLFPKDGVYYKSDCCECRNKLQNERYRKKREEFLQTIPESKLCDVCHTEKELSHFGRLNSTCCMECVAEQRTVRVNENRRQKYHSDEEYRKNLIRERVEDKQKKAAMIRTEKQAYQTEIGLENQLCKYCEQVKHKDRFRHNRRKCRDCEREDPVEKFKRCVRGMIHYHLHNISKKKDKHTVDYLGCSTSDYQRWLSVNDSEYTIENHGKLWHIDHVIPLSKFDLNDPAQIVIAFNWRNTMPLSAKENLQKNCKLVRSQIEQHYTNLVEYHTKENIELPQVFIDLFARYLVAGNS